MLHQHKQVLSSYSLRHFEIDCGANLRSLLLGWGTADVFPNISSIVERPCTRLDTCPDISSRRRGRLGTNEAVDSCLKLSELSFNESGLSESGTEEGSVDCDQNPGALRWSCDPQTQYTDSDEQQSIEPHTDAIGNTLDFARRPEIAKNQPNLEAHSILSDSIFTAPRWRPARFLERCWRR